MTKRNENTIPSSIRKSVGLLRARWRHLQRGLLVCPFSRSCFRFGSFVILFFPLPSVSASIWRSPETSFGLYLLSGQRSTPLNGRLAAANGGRWAFRLDEGLPGQFPANLTTYPPNLNSTISEAKSQRWLVFLLVVLCAALFFVVLWWKVMESKHPQFLSRLNSMKQNQLGSSIREHAVTHVAKSRRSAARGNTCCETDAETVEQGFPHFQRVTLCRNRSALCGKLITTVQFLNTSLGQIWVHFQDSSTALEWPPCARHETEFLGTWVTLCRWAESKRRWPFISRPWKLRDATHRCRISVSGNGCTVIGEKKAIRFTAARGVPNRH